MRQTGLCAVIIVAVLAANSPARAEDDAVVGLCNYFAGRITELTRDGEHAKARALRPQLVKCIAVLKDQQLRNAKRFIRQYNDALERSKGEKI